VVQLSTQTNKWNRQARNWRRWRDATTSRSWQQLQPRNCAAQGSPQDVLTTFIHLWGWGRMWGCLSLLPPVSLSRIWKKIRPLRVCGGTCGVTMKAKSYGYALYQVCSVALCH
jgi:hypothetical protein